jgi:hypothetical protein
MSVVHRFTVFADYFQFIVMDEQSKDAFDLLWTPEALDMALAVGESAVCPGTLRNVDVPVEIHVCTAPPSVDPTTYDHAVEASIDIPSGVVAVMSCTGYFPDVPRFKVQPGIYRVLSLMAGTDSIETEWESANDTYILYLWAGEKRDARLLKHWKRAV